MSDTAAKQDLKELREARKTTIEAVRERVKKNRKVQKTLSEALKSGAATIPELAQQTGLPSPDVLWHLTSMKKYGKVAEGDQSGDYFTYKLIKE